MFSGRGVTDFCNHLIDLVKAMSKCWRRISILVHGIFSTEDFVEVYGKFDTSGSKSLTLTMAVQLLLLEHLIMLDLWALSDKV